MQFTLAERFWAKVNKNGPVPPHRPDLGPCWIWTGHTDDRGRGSIWAGRSERTHRVSFFLEHGHYPLKGEACHHCDNTSCVRPSHLFDGTHDDNMKDAKSKGRLAPMPSRKGAIGARGEENGRAKLNEDDVRFIRSSSLSSPVLSRMLNVSSGLICSIRQRKTWKHVEGLVTPTSPRIPSRGESSTQAKLTEDDVRFIRSSTLSSVALGKMLGVAKSLVFRIRRHKAWKHVI